MATLSFAAAVEKWVHKVKEAEEAVFRQSVQRLSHELTEQLQSMVYEKPESPNYKRTRFLMSSLVASKSEMPRLSLDNPGVLVTPDFGAVELVINNAEIGETIYLGYTAKYGSYVHYGTEDMPPRPWVNLVAQRWRSIVAEEARAVKAAFGL